MVNKMHDETISPFVEKHNRNEMLGGYMYVYMYMYAYVYMCICICVCIYICICVYVCVCAAVHIYILVYILKVYISFVARNLAQNGWKHKR